MPIQLGIKFKKEAIKNSIDWQENIDGCFKWEAKSRIETGLTLVFLTAAAKELNLPLPTESICAAES